MFLSPGTKSGRRRRPGGSASNTLNGQILFDNYGTISGTDNIIYVAGASVNNVTHTSDYPNSVPFTIMGNGTPTANLFQIGNTTATFFAVNATGVLVGNGNGLTSVTASVVANSGIFSNASGLFANLATIPGLQFSSGGLAVLAGNGLFNNSTGLQILPGNGMFLNTAGFQVYCGNGIGCNTTGVQLTTNSGVFVNSSGIFANLTSNNTVGGLQLTAAGGLAILAGNSSIVANSSGLFSTASGSTPATSLYFGNL